MRHGLLELPVSTDGDLLLLPDQPALSGSHLKPLLELCRAQPHYAAASIYGGLRRALLVLPRAQSAVLEVAELELAHDVDVTKDRR